jgi:hypothetical protein
MDRFRLEGTLGVLEHRPLHLYTCSLKEPRKHYPLPLLPAPSSSRAGADPSAALQPLKQLRMHARRHRIARRFLCEVSAWGRWNTGGP